MPNNRAKYQRERYQHMKEASAEYLAGQHAEAILGMLAPISDPIERRRALTSYLKSNCRFKLLPDSAD